MKAFKGVEWFDLERTSETVQDRLFRANSPASLLLQNENTT